MTKTAALLRASPVRLIEKASGFKLSPMQKALVAIATGKTISDLTGEVRECAVRALGYDEGPSRTPRSMFVCKGARGGGTYLTSVIAALRALTVDLSGLAAGEAARCAHLSTNLAQARHGLRYASGFIKSLGLAIVAERRDSFVLHRDDCNRDVEFAVLRSTNEGAELAGRWLAAVCVHEAALAADPSNGVAVDLSAIEKQARPRLLPANGKHPGGIILYETTARDAAGQAYEMFTDNFGKADARTVSFRATTLELQPQNVALQEHVDAERETDPINAAREFFCEWISDEGSGRVFSDEMIAPCIVDQPANLPPNPTLESWCGLDTGYLHDGSGLAIVRKETSGLYTLCCLRRWSPRKGRPLKPSEVINEALDLMELHGCRTVWSDTHGYASLLEYAQKRRSIHVKPAEGSSSGRQNVHRDAQEMFASGRFVMGNDHHLRRGLLRIVATRTSDGAISIKSPRRKGDHGDLQAAFVLALSAAWRRGAKGADPLPVGSKPSTYLRDLGITDANGKRHADGLDFQVDAFGNARPVAATSHTNPFANSNTGGSIWQRQNGF